MNSLCRGAKGACNCERPWLRVDFAPAHRPGDIDADNARLKSERATSEERTDNW